MDIKIFGSGCKNCQELYKNTKAAVAALKLDITVHKVEDIFLMTELGIIATPALAINDTLVSQGCVLSGEQIIDLIAKFNKNQCSCGLNN